MIEPLLCGRKLFLYRSFYTFSVFSHLGLLSAKIPISSFRMLEFDLSCLSLTESCFPLLAVSPEYHHFSAFVRETVGLFNEEVSPGVFMLTVLTSLS